jgi:hypothetical protein
MKLVLAAMGLADLQGTGSRLTLVSKKVPTNADKNQKHQNLEGSCRHVGT